MQQLMFSRNEMVIWTWLVSRAIVSSLSGLSKMVGHNLVVTSLDLKQYPAKDGASLLGGPENIVVGINLEVSGDATGHLMLIHEPIIAFELIDMQKDLPPGSTQGLGSLEDSILGEMGNVTGSLFLNAMADVSGLNLLISPPTVMIDMAGAILDIALAKNMQEGDDILVVKATFGAGERQIDGVFMILPSSEFIEIVLRHPQGQPVSTEYPDSA